MELGGKGIYYLRSLLDSLDYQRLSYTTNKL